MNINMATVKSFVGTHFPIMQSKLKKTGQIQMDCIDIRIIMLGICTVIQTEISSNELTNKHTKVNPSGFEMSVTSHLDKIPPTKFASFLMFPNWKWWKFHSRLGEY